MNSGNQFSWKNKNNIVNFLSAEFTYRMIKNKLNGFYVYKNQGPMRNDLYACSIYFLLSFFT